MVRPYIGIMYIIEFVSVSWVQNAISCELDPYHTHAMTSSPTHTYTPYTLSHGVLISYLKWKASSSLVFLYLGLPLQLIPIKRYTGSDVFPTVRHILHIMLLKIASLFLNIVTVLLIYGWSLPYFIFFEKLSRQRISFGGPLLQY